MSDSDWVSLNSKFFNLVNVTNFELEERPLYESNKKVWDIRVHFTNGKSNIVATMSSKDKGLTIIEEILDGAFYVGDRAKVFDPLAEPDAVKEEENNDIPF